MLKKLLVFSFILPVALSLTTLGCSGSQDSNKEKADNTMTEETYAFNPILVLETNKGKIEIELWPKVAPKATDNIVKLTKKGYYDGVIFHRVIKGFMIQGGDPTGTGRGGQSIWGHPFRDETSSDVTFDKRGLLAMANAGPNTNQSQFFITTKATPWLNGKHTIFGEVLTGYDVVETIENTPTDANDRPLEKIIIEKATIE